MMALIDATVHVFALPRGRSCASARRFLLRNSAGFAVMRVVWRSGCGWAAGMKPASGVEWRTYDATARVFALPRRRSCASARRFFTSKPCGFRGLRRSGRGSAARAKPVGSATSRTHRARAHNDSTHNDQRSGFFAESAGSDQKSLFFQSK